MDPKPSRLLSDGLMILGISGSAYVGAYWYELGFASRIGIPTELIAVDANGLMRFGAALLITTIWFFAYMPIMVGFHETTPAHATGLTKIVYRGLVFLGYFWVVWKIADVSTRVMWLLAIGPLLLVGFDLAFGYVLKKKGVAYRDALEELTERSGRTLLPYCWNRFLPDWVEQLGSYVAIAVCLFVLCFALGIREAKLNSPSTFIESKGMTEVVLRRYGDNLVVAPYDERTRTVQRSFQLINLNEFQGRLEVRASEKVQEAARVAK